MDQSEFVRRFCLRPQSFAWFLGAGASRGANLPTATDVIDDLKRRYYGSEENQRLLAREMQNPAVRERVDAFMQSRGFPEPWAPEEYSTYFAQIFGEDRKRQRAYLAKMLSEERASLAVGNRVLGALLGAGLCRCTFTTNFDSVVEKAVAEVTGKSLSAYHLEGSMNANDALNNEEFPLYVKLHGDFRYESLKNLEEDLRKQNAELSKCFVNALNRFGLVVAGYSGRDASVMVLLEKALSSSNPYPHGVFWLGMKGGGQMDVVSAFLKTAAAQGVTAAYVEIETFDTLMLRIWRNLDERPEDLDAKVRKARAAQVSIPRTKPQGTRPLLRFNALPVTSLPGECLRVDLKGAMTWERLRRLVDPWDHDLVATLNGAELWCWGTEAEIRGIFGEKVVAVLPQAIPPDWREKGRFHLKRFFEDALARSFKRERPLLTRRRGSQTYLIVDHAAVDVAPLEPLFEQTGKTTEQIAGLKVPPREHGDGVEKVYFAEAVRIALAVADERVWLLLTPEVWIKPLFARSFATDWLRERKADRLNHKHDALLSAWISILMGGAEPKQEASFTAFKGTSGPGNPRFDLINRTGYSWRVGR